MDLRLTDRTRDEEVERIVALGAKVLADHRGDGQGWAMLADPEGNEPRMNSGPAERGESGQSRLCHA